MADENEPMETKIGVGGDETSLRVKMTRGTPEVRSDKILTLMTFNI